MKLLPVLLTASLAANLGLAVAILTRNAPEPAIASPAGNRSATPAANSALPAGLREALAAGDAATLTAAGLPPEVVRQLGAGRAYLRQQERHRALQAKLYAQVPYWQFGGANRYNSQEYRDYRRENREIQREFRDTLRATLGDAAGSGIGHPYLETTLSADQLEGLRRIDEDYAELTFDLQSEMNGVQLPSDQERLRLLQSEKEKDIAAMLGPEGYLQYQLRTSSAANQVQNRFGAVITSDEEFRRVFALQKAFEDQFDFRNPAAASREWQQARREAEAQLQQQIATVLGPERMQTATRNTDGEYRLLTRLASRLNLPESAANTVYTLRDTYATESQQITANTALSREQRTEQLRALATRAQTEVERTLGAEAAGVYVQRSSWLNILRRGTAFSIDANRPGGAAINIQSPAVAPVPPAGARTP